MLNSKKWLWVRRRHHLSLVNEISPCFLGHCGFCVKLVLIYVLNACLSARLSGLFIYVIQLLLNKPSTKRSHLEGCGTNCFLYWTWVPVADGLVHAPFLGDGSSWSSTPFVCRRWVALKFTAGSQPSSERTTVVCPVCSTWVGVGAARLRKIPQRVHGVVGLEQEVVEIGTPVYFPFSRKNKLVEREAKNWLWRKRREMLLNANRSALLNTFWLMAV